MADSPVIQPQLAGHNPGQALFDAMKQKLERAGGAGDAGLREATEQFEAVFVTQMLQIMRGTVPRSELFEDDPGRDTYYHLFDTEIGRQAAARGSLGISDMLYRQLSRQIDAVREASSDAPPAGGLDREA